MNILRTCEAQILKMFKNIQPHVSAQKLDVLIKKKYVKYRSIETYTVFIMKQPKTVRAHSGSRHIRGCGFTRFFFL